VPVADAKAITGWKFDIEPMLCRRSINVIDVQSEIRVATSKSENGVYRLECFDNILPYAVYLKKKKTDIDHSRACDVDENRDCKK